MMQDRGGSAIMARRGFLGQDQEIEVLVADRLEGAVEVEIRRAGRMGCLSLSRWD